MGSTRESQFCEHRIPLKMIEVETLVETMVEKKVPNHISHLTYG
jgi:hypothetical protein